MALVSPSASLPHMEEGPYSANTRGRTRLQRPASSVCSANKLFHGGVTHILLLTKYQKSRHFAEHVFQRRKLHFHPGKEKIPHLILYTGFFSFNIPNIITSGRVRWRQIPLGTFLPLLGGKKTQSSYPNSLLLPLPPSEEQLQCQEALKSLIRSVDRLSDRKRSWSL